MNKTKLNNFISKYHLGGQIETARWAVTDSTLNTGFISDDRSLVGYVTMNDFNLRDSEFAIYTTSDLVKILDTLDDDIDVTLDGPADTPTSIRFNDGEAKANFALANMKNVPPAPGEKKLPEWDVTMSLDSKFITRFNKSVNALKADKFTIVYDKQRGEYTVVLGHSDINTNRITIDVESNHTSKMDPMDFNALNLKEILNANKESLSFELHVSSAGLAYITFDLGTYKAKYFLIEIPRVSS